MAISGNNSFKLLIGFIFVAIIATAVGVVLYQTNTRKLPQGEIRTRAADPCDAYTKGASVTTKDGTVKSLKEDQFAWSEDKYGVEQSTGIKVVIICAGTQFKDKTGGTMTFADMRVGQKVAITGWYGDATNITLLAQQVQAKKLSVSPPNKMYDSSTSTATIKYTTPKPLTK